MKYYIIAGEASGDLHASHLIREIRQLDPSVVIRAWGGDRMAAQGADIVKHYKELDFMGFLEVVAHLPAIIRNLKLCKKDILAFKPDVLVLVDYPGFNLRIAQFAHKKGIKVVYYISPQVWAWKRKRAFIIRRAVDRMLVVLPFEQDFYKQFGVKADFVGHPLLDELAVAQAPSPDWKKQHGLDERPLIALLPGSRKQEIKRMLVTMREMSCLFTDYQFVIAAAPSVEQGIYAKYIQGYDLKWVVNHTYNLLKHAQAALVTSGTATLETALLGVPEVVCYKGNLFSYYIARHLVKVKYISLTNLIMDKPIVAELIQGAFTVANLKTELDQLLNDEQLRKDLLEEYALLREKLGKQGASKRAAAIVVQTAEIK